VSINWAALAHLPEDIYELLVSSISISAAAAAVRRYLREAAAAAEEREAAAAERRAKAYAEHLCSVVISYGENSLWLADLARQEAKPGGVLGLLSRLAEGEARLPGGLIPVELDNELSSGHAPNVIVIPLCAPEWERFRGLRTQRRLEKGAMLTAP